jgi:predicted nucleotidyltransferase
MSAPDILLEIKRRVAEVEPSAQVLVYGSYARGEQGPESDIDLLILLPEGERVGYDEGMRVKSPLYRLEWSTGTIISPLVYTRKEWLERHKGTPFFYNVQRDAVSL